MKSVFAQRFLDRVEETFFNENKHHKFIEFLQILRNFSEEQQQSGAQLYLVSSYFGLSWSLANLNLKSL